MSPVPDPREQLERQRRHDAADAVLAVSGRIGELLAAMNPAGAPDPAA
jgi:hypothetical protein